MTNKTVTHGPSHSTTRFHAPAERSELKISAQAHLTKLFTFRAFPERDTEILCALNDVGFLTRHQIQQLFFPSKNTATQRLRTLYDKHILNAAPDFWYHFIKPSIDFPAHEKASPPDSLTQQGLVKSFIYTPSLTGRHYLSLLEQVPLDELNFDPYRYNSSGYNHLIIHDLWISEAYVKFRLASEHFELPFAWRNEAQSKISSRFNPYEEIVRPDATYITSFSLQPDAPLQQSVKFIEMDRGGTKWGKKVDLYNSAYDDGSWRSAYNSFPVVLCVVPDQLFKKSIAQMKKNLGPVEFCVSRWSEFLSDPLSWFSVNSEKQISILPKHY